MSGTTRQKRQALKRKRKREALLQSEAIPREAHRLAMAHWDQQGVERDHPDWEYAAELTGYVTPCTRCNQEVAVGVTIRGKESSFDPCPPHRNHLVTCPRR